MGEQRIGLRSVEFSHDRKPFSRLCIVDAGEGSREPVFAEVPAIGSVERRCLTGRAQVFVVPESRQVELALVGLEVSSRHGSDVEVDLLLRCDGECEL